MAISSLKFVSIVHYVVYQCSTFGPTVVRGVSVFGLLCSRPHCKVHGYHLAWSGCDVIYIIRGQHTSFWGGRGAFARVLPSPLEEMPHPPKGVLIVLSDSFV